MSRLVIGMGAGGCGDAAVGPCVADGIEALRLPDVRTVVREDPAGLIELWGRAATVVVVTGITSGAMPGTVVSLDIGDGSAPLAGQPWVTRSGGAGRTCGLAAAVELARALHRLPPRLVLVGVEGLTFDEGLPMSAAVVRAVPQAVRSVTDVVSLAPRGLALPV